MRRRLRWREAGVERGVGDRATWSPGIGASDPGEEDDEVEVGVFENSRVSAWRLYGGA